MTPYVVAEPSKRWAGIIIPGGERCAAAADLLIASLRSVADERGLQ